MNIRNRIKELRTVNPEDVAPNPRNWRAHPQAQRDALRGILAQVGIAAPVIAYESPNGLMLIDGHERMTVGVPFPCVILDVNEDEANALLATFDPIGAMAETNQEKFADLIKSTTFESQALNDLASSIIKPIEAFEPFFPPSNEQTEDEPLEQFETYDENLETSYCCPKCKYEWSGKPR